MESFERRLKDDASNIQVTVSPELDDRIRASLENVTPMSPQRETAHPSWFWWATSLTGAAAAAVVLAVVNLTDEETGQAPPPAMASVPALAVPKLDVRPAMAPLETELENLKGDLEKAEQVLRDDLDRILGEAPPE